ncbi:hypothetical protein SAMN00120144_2028 [Hymenobacter roseosalivarius DSM 11622]|uniref:Uncharacterized protein n=1 Tax=Hymenobacter roseosalivarius DSM 11622 TaxID=645990 RepID=A0A1W1VMG2_9BACT|nr:hypothetical protein SAMN00120144_2028 [Hymenobacter roseosalivarius DSM 11622]
MRKATFKERHHRQSALSFFMGDLPRRSPLTARKQYSYTDQLVIAHKL